MLLVASISGCSLALSQPDPLRAAHVAPRCDTGKGLVALDWVLAGVMATVALTALSNDAGELGAASALTSAAFLASAARGNGVVNSCREEFAVYSQYSAPEAERDEVARRPAAPVAPRRSRAFEDPYASPSDLPARKIARPPAVSASVPAGAGAAAPAPAPSAPQTTQPAKPVKPAASAAPEPADDWSDFWTELP